MSAAPLDHAPAPGGASKTPRFPPFSHHVLPIEKNYGAERKVDTRRCPFTGERLGYDRAVTVQRQAAYRQAQARVGRPLDWIDEDSAARCGRELARLGASCSGLKRYAREQGGWTAGALARFVDVVSAAHQATDTTHPDALSRAMQRADGCGWLYSRLTPAVSVVARCEAQANRLTRILVLADVLQQDFRHGDWAAFGSCRIAEWLDMSTRQFERDLKLLADAGLLAVLKDDQGRTVYSYAAGLAQREVRWPQARQGRRAGHRRYRIAHHFPTPLTTEQFRPGATQPPIEPTAPLPSAEGTRLRWLIRSARCGMCDPTRPMRRLGSRNPDPPGCERVGTGGALRGLGGS